MKSHEMRRLLLAPFFLVASILLAHSSPAAVQNPVDKQVRVTFSAFEDDRRNPKYFLEGENLKYVKKLLAQAKPILSEANVKMLSYPGDSAIFIENLGGVNGLPKLLMVYQGEMAALDEKDRKFYIDDNRALESFLVKEAVKRGLIPDKIAEEWMLPREQQGEKH
jgi:hypothetical protein